MTEKLQFTDEEIRRQLELLGFIDVSHQQLLHFKDELEQLLELEKLSGEFVDCRTDDAEGYDARLVLTTFKPCKNVVIEKLPVETIDRSRFRTRSDRLRPDKENHNMESGTLKELEAPIDKYPWTAKDVETNSDMCQQDIDDNSNEVPLAGRLSRLRTRKVLRKKNGKVNVEISGPTAGTTKPNNVLKLVESRPPTSRLSVKSESVTSCEVPKRWRSVSDLGITKRSIYRSKSVLLPYTNNTQAHVYYKSDPVALFHYYKREWSNCNIPGEKDHRELRWNIRQSLAMGYGSTSTSSSTVCKSEK